MNTTREVTSRHPVPVLVIAVLLVTAMAAAQAQVRALVIGIDVYRHGSSLQGAVNDARDLAASLRHLGVKDLTVLLNGEATRGRITKTWQSLLARSSPGDTLVLTYAGHGSQEPEHVPGSEEDGKDEVLLLGGFEERGPGSRERLIDDEINNWLRQAGDKGLDVIFVADSCHSGTLTRSFDPRAGGLTVRYSAYRISEDMLHLDLPPAAAAIDEGDLPNVTFLAAGQEHETVPEIELPGAAGLPVKRGALSFLVARALEGEADADGDHRLTRGELKRFVRENVRVLAEARQTPNLLPRGAEARVLLPLARSVNQGPAPGGPGLVRLRVVGADAVAALAGTLEGVLLVGRAEGADLVYDAAARQVISAQGDVVARDVGDADLQGVVDKWAGLGRLKAHRRGDRLLMRVIPDDGAHKAGDVIGFEVDGIRQPYLVLFSLSGNGTLHFHFPLPGEPPVVPLGQPVRYEFRVTPPFGADHVVAVTGARPMTDLMTELRGLDGRPGARRAVSAVIEATGKGAHQLGIQGLYTAP